MEITNARQARTLSTSHMRQCIMSEHRFDFLKDLVKDIPNISWAEEYMQGEGVPSDTANAIMPVQSPSTVVPNGNQMMTMPMMAMQGSMMDRPRRSNYQRPMSFDAASISVMDNGGGQGFILNLSQNNTSHVDDSPTGILKRKLLDPARKSASTDGGSSGSSSSRGGGGHAKLARLDSSPAAFSDQMLRKSSRAGTKVSLEPRDVLPSQASRRRKSNDGGHGMGNLSPILLPPTVNISSESISTPIIKIDYSQPNTFGGVTVSSGGSSSAGHSSEMTPVINIDFSNLISPTAVPLATVSNGNKLLLSTAAVEAKTAGLATPNLTTPTRLNFVPPFPSAPAVTNPAMVSTIKTALGTTVEMDEDYDDL